MKKQNRRDFLRTTAAASAGLIISPWALGNGSGIMGSNNRLRVGIVGFSDRAAHSLIPAFMSHADELNMEIVAVSDIWNHRRDEAKNFFEERYNKKVEVARNNEELYEKHKPDAVIISTADFQHALHGVQAMNAGCDIYLEKPVANRMDDAKQLLKTAKETGKVVQIGTQRRSGANYRAAKDYLDSGTFGDITMVEMSWNVNQPGRWRRPGLVASIKKEDTDWERYLMNRPYEEWDPRKYLEYRLFWPYSSGIPGQWMVHQIDTVHWFSGYSQPRSVVANGGIYMWKDGRRNWDTLTAVFDYGPADDPGKGFQVVYSSRQHNSAGGVKEIYYSNGGELNLVTNKVTPNGGLAEKHARAMDMKPFLLDEYNLEQASASTDANMGADNMTSANMRNWMECLRSRQQTNAPVEVGYNHAKALCMVVAAQHTGSKARFDEEKQEVVTG